MFTNAKSSNNTFESEDKFLVDRQFARRSNRRACEWFWHARPIRTGFSLALINFSVLCNCSEQSLKRIRDARISPLPSMRQFDKLVLWSPLPICFSKSESCATQSSSNSLGLQLILPVIFASVPGQIQCQNSSPLDQVAPLRLSRDRIALVPELWRKGLAISFLLAFQNTMHVLQSLWFSADQAVFMTCKWHPAAQKRHCSSDYFGSKTKFIIPKLQHSELPPATLVWQWNNGPLSQHLSPVCFLRSYELRRLLKR